MSYKNDKRSRFTIIASNVKEYVTNKSIRAAATFVITGEGAFYLVGNEPVPEGEFEQRFPTQLKPIALHGKNVDRTKNWWHGDKSY